MNWGPVEDIEELLQLANSISDFPSSQLSSLIEKLVAPAGAQGRLDKFRARRDLKVEKIDAFRGDLLAWINRQCLQFSRPKANQIYDKLVELLAKKRIPVYTTNYDAVLDHVAQAKGIEVADNFIRDRFGRWFWDPTHKSFSMQGLPVIKIHGSIQWHSMPDGRIEKISTPAKLSEEGHSLKQLMIFPTRFKDIYKQNYFSLYSSFTRALGRVHALIVIGHSLRDEYLFAAIRERLREPDFVLVICDPELPIDIKKLKSQDHDVAERIVHLNAGIETLHPLLLQALDNVPSETIGEHLRVAAKALGRRKEKVALTGMPRWVRPGESVGAILSVKTIIGGVSARCWIRPGSPGGKQIEIPLILNRAAAFDNIFNGMMETKLEAEWRVPENLPPGVHNVVVALVDQKGKVTSDAIRRIDVPKK